MLRRNNVSILGLLVLGWLVLSLQPPVHAQELPLIETDSELADFCSRAQELVDQGQYRPALEIYQGILDHDNSGYMAGEDGHFYPLSEWINQRIAQLPAEARELYRELYSNQAHRDYRHALAEGDEALLRSVALRYWHTPWGEQAMDLLAQRAFDGGRFLEAAQRWQQLLELAQNEESTQRWLVQACVASHLGGALQQARDLRDALVQEYPQARLELAGQEQDAVAFLDTMLARPVASSARPVLPHWPGQGATGGGVVCMTTPERPDVASWSWPDPTDEDPVVPFRHVRVHSGYAPPQQNVSAVDMRLVDGRVAAVRTLPPPAEVLATLPAYIHPVVWNDTLVIRSYEGIVACDMTTGDLNWLDAFRAEENVVADYGYGGMYYPYGPSNEGPVVAYDSGHYQPVVGGDLLYVVGGYADGSAIITSVMAEAMGGSAGMQQATPLRAYALTTGRLVWSTESSTQMADDPILAGTVFVSPPAYADGRVYLIGTYARAYWLNCFDGDTGELLWRRHLSHMPEYENFFSNPLLLGLLARASAPAIADGRVLALTNVGTISAFDAYTGQAMWAYQYPSVLTPAGRGIPAFPFRADDLPGATNPILVSQGRAVFMPTDSDQVICLDARTGQPRWNVAGRGQHYLTALDGRRVALSRPNLIVLDIADGATLMVLPNSDLYGRPAVAEDVALFSGRERIYQLTLHGELTAESVSSIPMPDVPLGNLVVAGDRLISANLMGVYVMINYALFDQELTERLASTALPDDVRARLLYQRGDVALQTGRYADAQTDLHASFLLGGAMPTGNPAAIGVKTLLHYAIIGRGCEAQDPEEKLHWFSEAEAWCVGESQEAENLLRQIKCVELAGDYAGAMELAHELLRRYPMADLADVSIAPGTDVLAVLTTESIRLPAQTLIEEGYVPRLLDVHGQEIYAALDRQARQRMDQAIADSDIPTLLTLGEEWPNTQWVDDAMLAAAELYYLQAGQTHHRARREELTQSALDVLNQLIHLEETDLAATAQMLIAAIYDRQGQRDIAQAAMRRSIRLAEQNGQAPANMRVDFGDIQGTLLELAAVIQADATIEPDTPEQPTSRVSLSLPGDDAFLATDMPTGLLCDGRGVGLVADGAVFLVGPGRLCRLNLHADDAASSQAWSLSGDQAELIVSPQVAGLSEAGDVLVLCGDDQAIGYDVANGQQRWRQSIRSLAGGDVVDLAIAAGRLVILSTSDRLVTVDAATGRRLTNVATDMDCAGGSLLAWGNWVFARTADGHQAMGYNPQHRQHEIRFEHDTPMTLVPMGTDGLAMLVGNEVSGYRLSAPAVPIWQRTVPAGVRASLLHAGPQGVVIEMRGASGSRLEVVDPAGQSIGRAQSRPFEGRTTWARQAYLDDGMLYVVCDNEMGGIDGWSILCFDLAEGRQMWHTPFAPDSPSDSEPLTPVLTERYILTGSVGGRLFALNRLTGQWVSELRIQPVAGNIVVHEGRLVVPVAQGVLVHASRP
jgi:outer membrane protein assembly factor BamB